MSNKPTNTKSGETPKTMDYLSLFINGLSTDEIKQGASERGASVVMPGAEQARSLYKGISDEDFNTVYKQASDSYGKYQQGEFNGRVAPLWKYAPSTPASERRGHVSLSGQGDFGKMPSTGIPGIDQNGNQYMTEEQIADSRGEVLNDKTGKWESYDPSFSASVSNLAKDYVLYKDYDANGSPIWRKNDRSDVKDQEHIRSAFGAEPMTRSYMGAMGAAVYNTLPTLVSGVGTILETGDNLFDLLSDGKNKSSDVERAGELIQSYADSFRVASSQRGKESPFSNLEAFSGAVGSVAAQLGLMMATGGASAAVGLGATASSWVGYGTMGVLGMDMFNQSSKEMGIDKLDIAWMAPIVAGIETFTEAFIGPNIIQKGSEAIIEKAVMKETIKKSIQNSLTEAGVKVFSDLTKGQKLSVAKKIGRYFIETLPKSGIGRGVLGEFDIVIKKIKLIPQLCLCLTT